VVFAKHPYILIASVVVLKSNLSIVEEKSSKNKGVLTLIENKQSLVIYYPSNVNLNVFTCPVEYLRVPRNCL